ncbi:MAG: copper oxidase [Betaproteobacteria bacterium RIFCSPHIGHO2_12_FULL_69_13]|nr:MAG: copper oxidase [Betaproteobacteria bacterium RIFCSPHIGHO2_12_FULL_69_13]OGA65865.1 MAG: copper oxidase [Betaproteobacteria bacterium RIFCSPLOWO2_12_FULL_68_20]
MTVKQAGIDRREFLGAGAALAGLAALPSLAGGQERTLRARVSRASLVGAAHPQTEVWTYDGAVPGPELRFRQGERLRVELENLLPGDTTVHWHGVRVPNGMDGVPGLTQPPIKANGGRFVYEFALPDAGTYWYHPHLDSSNQVGRGVYAPLIVEEPEPPRVDRDVVWMLGDWRLDRQARIVADFGNFMDASHAGRIGNTVTVNGAVREAFELRAGERVRLRLVNAANARIFALDFRGHDPLVIALDGQPVEPHRPEGKRVVLGPSMRIDVLLDATGEPGSSYAVVDDFYPRQAYRLLDLRYSKERVRGAAGAAMPKLAPNPLAEPDLGRAERHTIEFGGGMMGNAPMMGMMRGMAWTVNGRQIGEHDMDPILKLGLGRSYAFELVNDTQWHHPIHLHGHVFRVLTRDGKPTRHREWLDTVLMPPRSRAGIAFVADNPGDWMIHCHILEHAESGMMAVIRVA